MTLVSHWPLTEDSGSTAYDYSGQGNDGTANGAGPSGTGTVSGPLGQSAYDFDGTDDNIQSLELIDAITAGGTFSVTFWINHSGGGTNLTVFENISSSSDRFGVRKDSNGDIDIAIYNGSNSVSDVSAPIRANEWEHVVYTVKSGSAKLFINGADVNTGNAGGFISATTGVTVGSNNSEDNFFDGQLADFRIYDRALSPSEIQYLYNVSQSARLTSETKTL